MWIATGLVIAGTAMSVYGQIQQGEAARIAGEDNQRIADNNAAIARSNADAEFNQQSLVAKNLRSRQERLAGAQRSAAANSGLLLNGSVADVMTDSQLQSQMDIHANYQDSNNRISGMLQQSSDFTAQGSLAKTTGKNTQNSSYWGAGGSLLSGAGAAYGTNSNIKYRKSGNKID